VLSEIEKRLRVEDGAPGIAAEARTDDADVLLFGRCRIDRTLMDAIRA
jgi:hypothetical protein